MDGGYYRAKATSVDEMGKVSNAIVTAGGSGRTLCRLLDEQGLAGCCGLPLLPAPVIMPVVFPDLFPVGCPVPGLPGDLPFPVGEVIPLPLWQALLLHFGDHHNQLGDGHDPPGPVLGIGWREEVHREGLHVVDEHHGPSPVMATISASTR